MRLAASAFVVLASASFALAGDHFAHVQTDKPQYRLGETVWYRVHARPAVAGTTVSLVRPDGSVAAKKTELDGSFVIGEDSVGGDYRLRVEASGEVLHEVKLAVYDLTTRQLDVGLVVLGEILEPGDTATATVSVREQNGTPVEGARVTFRAMFGPLVVAGPANPTDAEGRSLVRFAIPAEAQRDGFLAVGIETPSKKTGALARTVPVSAGISRIDAYPEGGSILPGGSHRLGLLARDLDGEPALCEGRVLDDKNATVALFRTDRRGIACVDFLHEKERTYRVELDRPARVKTPFALPGATGHEYALRMEHDAGLLAAVVRGKKGEAELLLVRADGRVTRTSVHVTEEGTKVALAADAFFEAERLVLVANGRAILATPLLGGSRPRVNVTIKARETRALPGDTVTLDVTARDIFGNPVACDLALSAVNEGALAEQPRSDLAVRALVSKAIGGSCSDVAGLDETGVDGYLLVHGALAYPPEGVAMKGREIAPEPAHVRPPAIAPRALPVAPDGGKSVVKGSSALDRLMQRAPFTRFATPRPASDESFGLAVDEAALPDLAPRGKLPQDVQSLRFDCRDTLLWRGKITTNKEGLATASFRISQEVTPLLVLAQGFSAQGVAVAGAARVVPAPSFSVKTTFPQRVTVGDIMESFVTVEVRDGEQLPLQIAITAPPCLKALERTELTFDPRTSARDQKFRFEVIAEAADVRLQVVAVRGAFRQVTTRRFSAGRRDVELSFGRRGYETAGQTCALKVPDDAMPGTVTATTHVTTTRSASTQESVDRLLQEPHGCFEQTTACNYPNLVILEALRTRGDDAKTLERATLFARKGFERILRFQDPDSGGFSLWDHTNKPQARYTAMAVLQLAHFAKLFEGKGSFEMRKAIRYLDRLPADALDDATGLYVAFAAAEAGYAWPRGARLLDAKPATNYERALQLALAAAWPGAWTAKTPRDALVAGLARTLEDAQDKTTGAIPSNGSGVMGSQGASFVVETTSLAALAFVRAGRAGPAVACAGYLEAAKAEHGGWGGTQATVLAIRALAAFGTAPRTDTILVAFSANGRTMVAPAGERGRPLVLERPLDAAPGSTVKLALEFKTTDPLSYGLSLRYRVAKPKSSKTAAYSIETSLPARIVGGNATPLKVSLTKLHDVQGQVVAKIALPGGCEPTKDALKDLGGSAHQELENGFLVLYWETPPGSLAFDVPVIGVAPGCYATAPSTIYPYYETGREAFAAGLETRVLGAFNMDAGGATLRGR